MEGTPFGRYRLIELLGRGGMGEVWRAFDTTFDRVVALKVLPANFADDDVFQERFRREAKAAAGLDEPHVVPIFDFGEIDGRLFVTMRLIKGRDLEEVLRDGPLAPSRAVGIIEQVASALHAAHRIRLVHRDVKPSNILVAEDDFAYLIDFGIARAAGETGLTNTGATIGTWSYMAPERFQDGRADVRADIYALACVLYESLTGQLPFPGNSLEQIAVGHMLRPPPPPSALQDNVSPQMDQVIATGMAKNPDQRFATTKDLADAARAALIIMESAQRPTAQAPRRSEPKATREFSQRWPNPAGTGYTPYKDHAGAPETPLLRSGFGSGRVVLAVGAAVMLAAAALLGGFWLSFGRNRGEPPGGSLNPVGSTPPTTSQATIGLLPGTDSLGFIGYPNARCNPGNQPAVMARTTLSVVVVCQIGPGDFYYRAVRVSDGASIELANAVRTSNGFDVANPADGTQRQVRPTAVTIAQPDGQVSTEPVLAYSAK